MLSENGKSEAFLLGPERFSPAHRRRLSGPGLRTFLAIVDHWHLDEGQRRWFWFAIVPALHGWMRAVLAYEDITLDADVLTRSRLSSASTGRWPSCSRPRTTRRLGARPHKGDRLGGQCPLALITNGTLDALLTVRRSSPPPQQELHGTERNRRRLSALPGADILVN